jgi:hypothetical protein
LEAAKLRQLVLGALRGIVKPGYAFGVNSVVRERLLLNAMSQEIDGQAMMDRGLVEAMMVPVVQGSRRPAAYRQAISYLRFGHSLNRLMPGFMTEAGLSADDQKEIKGMGSLLKALKSTDFCDRMARLMKY